MRRTYSRERYMDRVALIREHVPDCAITTDIIVGFPGETEADFEQTLEVVDEVGYDGAFTFIFSPRRGTEAADFDDQLSHAVKRERMERLVELVQRRARERAERFVGRTMEVLVEGPSRTDPSRLRGRTRHNKTVNFDGHRRPRRAGRGRDQRRDLDHPERAGAPAQPRGLTIALHRPLRPDRPSARPASRSPSPSGCASAGRTRSRSTATRSRSTAASRP